jgi:hypothetical protein
VTKNKPTKKPASGKHGKPPVETQDNIGHRETMGGLLWLIACWFVPTLKMKVIYFSEISVGFF